MSINFPEEQVAQQEAFKQYINQLFTDVERIWKRLTPEADWSPGAPSTLFPDIMGSPTNQEGGGSTVEFKVGQTVGPIDKGSSGLVNILLYNGSAEALTGASITARNLFGNIKENKKVGCIKSSTGTNSTWYIISAEC